MYKPVVDNMQIVLAYLLAACAAAFHHISVIDVLHAYDDTIEYTKIVYSMSMFMDDIN